MRYINEVIIHCTATKADRKVTVDDVRRWHKQRGFRDIGYHYLIDQQGNVHRGRPLSQAGSHCRGYNAHSIGVCYVGGVGNDGKSADTRTIAQVTAMQTLVYRLCRQYGAKVTGHREHPNAHTECPGFDAGDEFRELAKAAWRMTEFDKM